MPATAPDPRMLAPQMLRNRDQLIQLQMAAANGDPQAQAMLQQMQGGGGAPGGPPQQPPGMSQSQFSGYGNGAVPPDVAAARTKKLIELLRARGE